MKGLGSIGRRGPDDIGCSDGGDGTREVFLLYCSVSNNRNFLNSYCFLIQNYVDDRLASIGNLLNLHAHKGVAQDGVGRNIRERIIAIQVGDDPDGCSGYRNSNSR